MIAALLNHTGIGGKTTLAMHLATAGDREGKQGNRPLNQQDNPSKRAYQVPRHHSPTRNTVHPTAPALAPISNLTIIDGIRTIGPCAVRGEASSPMLCDLLGRELRDAAVISG